MKGNGTLYVTLSKEASFKDLEENDSMTQISTLERFAADDSDLYRLEKTLQQFDAFAFLGLSGSEETHSRILAWLLDPRETHSVGDFFLTALLRKTRIVSCEQIRTIDWSNTTVQREWHNVVTDATGFLDILILNTEAGFACAIENKVFSNEHSEQLSRYRKAIEQRYGSLDRRSYLFVSRQGSLPARLEERRHWKSVDYKTILQLVEDTIKRGVDPGNEAVVAFLRQYTTTLRRRIVPDTEVKRMATRIYLQHREAIDLIYRHKEDYIDDLIKIFREAIDHHRGWEFIGERDGNKLLAFIDTSWKEFRAFHTGTTLPGNDALLWLDFDFRVTGEVTLNLTVSEGSAGDDVRKRLFKSTQGRHPEIFDHRGSPRGGYRESTIRLYASKPILSRDDIINEDRAYWRERIIEWVSNFAEVEFQQMNRIIVDSFREVEGKG